MPAPAPKSTDERNPVPLPIELFPTDDAAADAQHIVEMIELLEAHRATITDDDRLHAALMMLRAARMLLDRSIEVR